MNVAFSILMSSVCCCAAMDAALDGRYFWAVLFASDTFLCQWLTWVISNDVEAWED